MSEYEEVLIATADKPSQFSRLLVDRLGFEHMPGHDPEHSEDLGLRRRALTTDGFVGLRVSRNIFVDPDPYATPDDVQAFGAYPLQIQLWIPKPRLIEAQEAEARAWFDRLVAAWPDLPMLLTHEVTLLYAAYLPGKPVHDFPLGTTVDAEDIGAWLPWVIKTATMPA
jgi:hypothetical protein